MKRLGRETTLGLCMLAFGIIMIIMTLGLPNTESQLFDSRFMPAITGVIMILMGLIHLYNNRNEKAGERENLDNKTLLITIVLLFFYVLTYGKLGFVVTSSIFLFLEFINLTPNSVKKKYVLYLVLAIVLPVVVYYLFYFGFKIILPAGVLKGIL